VAAGGALTALGCRWNEMEQVRFYWLILGTLSTWRLTHMLHAEDGPARMFARFRRKIARTFLAAPIDCFYCLSLWVAVPFAILIGGDVRERALLWPALSAGAILMEQISSWARPAPAVYWEGDHPAGDFESETKNDVLLRKN
jgi:hypothetical protein